MLIAVQWIAFVHGARTVIFMLIFGRPHKDSKGQSSSVESDESRRFDTALFSTLDALEAKKVSYALIGGVAAYTHGRPRPTQDIDIFVRPEDAEGVLEVLRASGFETTRFNPNWIYKAYKDGVLIDIIFKSEGNLYFDEEMNKKSVLIDYHGRQVRVVSAEDFVLIKCAAHSEEGHHHWHDALAVLSQAQLDWDYLIHRSRKAPRRLLALLIYAQAEDIWIPNHHIQKLYETLFEGHKKNFGPRPEKLPKALIKTGVGDTYLTAKIREALARDEKTGALDIEVYIQEEKILVRGHAHSDSHKKSILEIIRSSAPNLYIEDQVRVVDWQPPKDIEALQ